MRDALLYPPDHRRRSNDYRLRYHQRLNDPCHPSVSHLESPNQPTSKIRHRLLPLPEHLHGPHRHHTHQPSTLPHIQHLGDLLAAVGRMCRYPHGFSNRFPYPIRIWSHGITGKERSEEQ